MRLVAHWRLWTRRWSTWLAGIYAAASAVIFANPSIFLGLVGFFPGEWRGFAAGALFVILFAVPVIVTQLSQPKLKAKCDAERFVRIQTDG